MTSSCNCPIMLQNWSWRHFSHIAKFFQIWSTIAGYDELWVEFKPFRNGEIFWMNNDTINWIAVEKEILKRINYLLTSLEKKKMATVGYYVYERYSRDLRYQAIKNTKCEIYCTISGKNVTSSTNWVCCLWQKKYIASKPNGGRLLQMKQRIVIVGLYSRVSVAAQLGQSRRLSC